MGPISSPLVSAIEAWNKVADRRVNVPKLISPRENKWAELVEYRGYNAAIAEIKRLNPTMKFEEHR